MVKPPKIPNVEDELDGDGNIPVPRELRNGKKCTEINTIIILY